MKEKKTRRYLWKAVWKNQKEIGRVWERFEKKSGTNYKKWEEPVRLGTWEGIASMVGILEILKRYREENVEMYLKKTARNCRKDLCMNLGTFTQVPGFS